MNKNSLIFSLLLMSSFCEAEYMVKIPLEQVNGGSLPDGTIIIGNQGNQPDTGSPSDTTCLANLAVNGYYWLEQDGSFVEAQFGNILLTSPDNRFTRGGFHLNEESLQIYEICGPSELVTEVDSGVPQESEPDQNHPEDGCMYSDNPDTVWVRDDVNGWHWHNGYYVQFFVPHSIYWNGKKVFEYNMIEDPYSTEYQDMFIYHDEATGYTYYRGDFNHYGPLGQYYGVCRM